MVSNAYGDPPGAGNRPAWRLPVVAGAVILFAIVALALVTSGGGDDVLPGTTVPSAPSTTAASTTEALAPTTTSTTIAPTTTTTLPPPPTTLPPPPTTQLINGVPVFEPFEPLPGIEGVAALTGLKAGEEITSKAIIAVKVDNVRQARPQWGLDQADVIFEENVEQATRFVALFHSNEPDRIGPVRSARTGDIDILSGMNRPILVWSGGNRGVTSWIGAASDAGLTAA